MDMLSGIAAASVDFSRTQLATDYSMALTKKMMDTTEELALGELERMLPSPYTFDVYA